MVGSEQNINISESSLQSDDEILKKLKRALRSDGDFPVRAKVITELKVLAIRPNTPINQIAETILKEPALGTRVLHLVNSAFYQRSRPITTISQAVIHLGMLVLCDLCAGLVLLQRFRPAAKRGGFFADNLKKSITTSLLASKFAAKSPEPEISEHGYLAGSFYCIGSLLLAFYFPQVYESAARRAVARAQSVSQSISEILGIKPLELGQTILDALKIPEFYSNVLVDSYKSLDQTKAKGNKHNLGHSVAVAARLADSIFDKQNLSDLKNCISTLDQISDFSESELYDLILRLPEEFEQHCQMIDMAFLTLPDFLIDFVASSIESSQEENMDGEVGSSVTFSDGIGELKQAIKNNEPLSSIMTLTMEILVYAMGFDRAVLLLADPSQSSLIGKMALGKPLEVNIKTINKKFDEKHIKDPDILAFRQGAAQIFGKALFTDGWPFAAIPVGIEGSCRGIIYCDKLTDKNKHNHPLDNQQQAALSVITDLLNKAVSYS